MFIVAMSMSWACSSPGTKSVIDGPSLSKCPLTCGMGSDADCCSENAIPGGAFFRDFDVGTDGRWSDMSHLASVSSFRLDTFEVTVGRFREFIEAGAGVVAMAPQSGTGSHGRIAGSGWNPGWDQFLAANTDSLIASLTCAPTATWTDSSGKNENLPINCVGWYEAFAFCIWDSGYLPTVAEWNYAAVGGSDQRAYAWSQPPNALAVDCDHAAYNDQAGCSAMSTVGAKPAGNGRWGQVDLAGNVSEWSLDWLSTIYALPCSDCASLSEDPAAGPFRANRGGSFRDVAMYLRSADPRGGAQPNSTSEAIGVRCAHEMP